MGFYSANLGVQVFGGHGYVREWGMEQIVRDSKISTLYEGTTGIQAIDLIGRKVLMDKFFQLKLFSSDIMQFAAQFLPWKRDPQFSVMWKKAAKLVLLTMKWRYLAMRVGARSKRNRDNAGAASVDFLMFSGYLYMAFMWAKMSLEAHKQLAEGRGDAEFLKAKIHTADFFFAKMLPATDALGKQILAPLDSVMQMPESSF